MLLQPNEIRSMSAQAIRRIVEGGDGDAALLYLALLEWNECGKAQRVLHWGDERLSAAYRRLAELELVSAESVPVPAKEEPAEQVIQYSRKDVLDAMEREPEFRGLYREVERLLGRELGDADLTSLYRIYDQYALPAEVILLLVSYMIRAARQGGSVGAMPRMSQISSVASRWKRMGLETAEAVESYLRLQQQVDSREWEILSAMGEMKLRRAVTDERKMIESWVEMGIGTDLIVLAYERAVYNGVGKKWPYVNKILLAWHQAGWRTPEEVKAGDKPPRRGAPAAGTRKQENYQPSEQSIRESGDWLDEFLQQQKKGE